MFRWIFLLSIFVTPFSVLAVDENYPMMAGSLLAYWGTVQDPGEAAGVFYAAMSQQYNSYGPNSQLQTPTKITQYFVEWEYLYGLLPNLDFEFELNAFTVYSHGKTVTSLGDFPVYLSAQLVREGEGSYVPDVRVLIGEIFPTGNYSDLDPLFQGGDATGTGAFQTSFILAAQKTFERGTDHPSALYFNFFYSFFDDVHVKNRNAYGGAPGVRGTVEPGDFFAIDLAYEHKFNDPIGFSTDFFYQYQASSAFFPKPGSVPAEGAPSWDSFSMTPSIEYNYSESLSLILGSWFTVFGRNTPAFYALALSLYVDF